MRLPRAIVNSVETNHVDVFYAGRHTTKVWNSLRLPGEPLRYGGWYWARRHRGSIVETDADGPFKTESAAIRDAFVKLQLRTTAAMVLPVLALEDLWAIAA